MMKLCTMQALVHTLNDQKESPIADQILSFWEHDKGTARFFRASANFLFTFKNAGIPYFLRFIQTTDRSIDIIQAEMAYINYLASEGLSTSVPVKSKAGNLTESISTSLGSFNAVVFKSVKGKHLEFEELTPNNFLYWGRALGEFHKTSKKFHKANRPDWKDHLAMVSAYLPETEHAARAILTELQAILSELPASNKNYGLIHYDFELDNLLWEGDKARIIDFDDCAYYWFAADIAFALRDLFDDRPENVDFKNLYFQKFISGYRLETEIDQSDLDLIPVFLRLHNLISFTKLHRAIGTHSNREEIWVMELRNKLLKIMQSYRTGFSNSNK